MKSKENGWLHLDMSKRCCSGEGNCASAGRTVNHLYWSGEIASVTLPPALQAIERLVNAGNLYPTKVGRKRGQVYEAVRLSTPLPHWNVNLQVLQVIRKSKSRCETCQSSAKAFFRVHG